MATTSSYSVGILTISDRCSRGEAEDKSGPKLVETIKELSNATSNVNWTVTRQAIIPDEKDIIKKTLIELCDDYKLSLILTTGGTGFAPRDVTPEATKEVIEREAPGLVHAMMTGSLKVTPMAMLSRLTCGIRGKSLIVNLPGNTKGAVENFQFIIPALKHGVDVLLDHKSKVEDHHKRVNTHHQGGHVCPHRQETNTTSITSSSIGAELTSNVTSRPRKSPFPMITVKEAQEIVLKHCKSFHQIPETINFMDSLNRILAEDVVARDPLPPFPASIKDGYAVIASDGIGLREVIGFSNAGTVPSDFELRSGYCVRINTGAPVPNGADAVIQVEDTELTKKSQDGTEELEINIVQTTPVLKGQDIRPLGSDIEKGSTVLNQGTTLGPAEIGILATVGATEIKVKKRPTIALLSTGNELQNPQDGRDLKPGYIRDSNKSTLMTLINKEHGFPIFDCGIATDDLEDLKAKITLALNNGDLIVTTGGVSMGDKDLLRQVLVKDFQATIHFGRVHMKPGKPTTFATLKWNQREKYILGLPGNPVSATVTSHLYVLPAARAMSGLEMPFAATIKARVSSEMPLDPRPEYMRVVLSWDGQDPVAKVMTTGNQISSRLMSFKAANGLLMLPPKSENQSKTKKEDMFDVMVIGQLLQ